MAKKKPPHQQLAFNYFQKLNRNKPDAADEYYILNEDELKAMHGIRRKAMWTAGAIGAFAVLFYYVPLYLFPDFFDAYKFTLTLFSYAIEINYLTLSYSLVLILIEVFYLTKINIRSVAETANASGFPDKKDVDYDLHLEQLFNVGLETKSKETLQFGIDPYEGVPKFYILLFTIWNLVKATLTNFFVKLVVVKIVARAELRQFADLVGVPVFAIWNALAARRIIENAKVYIMAPGVIHQLVTSIQHLKTDERFKQNIFDALQYIASVKRNFHHNHYIMVKEIIEVFDLKNFKDMEPEAEAFLEKIKHANEEIKKAYSKLLVLGIFIDGSVSIKDSRVIKRLYAEGIINIHPADVKKWAKAFRSGKGLQAFVEY